MNYISCPACASTCDGKSEPYAEYRLFICSSCGLHFCDEQQLADVDYDAIYKTLEYEEDQILSIEKTTDWKVFGKIPTYRPFFEVVTHAPKAKLLDVGCGVGRFCRAASVANWDVTGIDVSKTAIEKGKATATFPMMSCTAEELADSGQVFDVVTAFEVLEHLSAPVNLLDTIQRLLKPGGSFFCSVPNWDSPTVKSSNRNDWVPPVHVLFFNAKALQALLARAGFKNIRTGVVWGNMPPELPGPKLLKYYFNRLTNRIGGPDPLGLWAVAEK